MDGIRIHGWKGDILKYPFCFQQPTMELVKLVVRVAIVDGESRNLGMCIFGCGGGQNCDEKRISELSVSKWKG